MTYFSLCPFVTAIVKVESAEAALGNNEFKIKTFYILRTNYICVFFTYLKANTNFNP